MFFREPWLPSPTITSTTMTTKSATIITSRPILRPFATTISSSLPSNAQSSSSSSSSSSSFHDLLPPLLLESDFSPRELIQQIFTAADYNQGTDRWQVDFCRTVAQRYIQHLQYIHDNQSETTMDLLSDSNEALSLVSPEVTERAIQGIIRQHLHPVTLSQHVRHVERLIGSIAKTPLTELLSYRLIEANGKAGNVGRTLALLNLRKSRGYDPQVPHEFLYAVAAIKVAGTELVPHRNIYAGDAYQPAIDNPTRWLDAILLNMHDRQVPLSIHVANRMLETYATTGRTGKAVHFFWKMYLQPIQNGNNDMEDQDKQHPPLLIDPLKISPDEIKTTKESIVYQNRKHRAKLVWRPSAPIEKIPSEVSNASISLHGASERMTKLEWEQRQDWSLPLTAAFAFADSLTHGACGHDPLELDVDSWNVLVKTCCYRGALWRAMKVIDEIMPAKSITPDAYSYTLLLDGLAKVGDVSTMKDYFRQVQNKDLVTRSNVRVMVDGMINAGDVAGAITFLQDMYNQYQIIVNHYCHLKVLEVALASDLIWEAERYVTIMDQIRSHDVNFALDEPDFCRAVEIFQKDPRTSRESLRKLFAYFGETLDERNFL